MSVKQRNDVKIFIIFTKRIVERLSHSQPTKYEEEFEGDEEGKYHINFLVPRLPPDDPLVGQERDGEEDVDGQVDDLGVDQRDLALVVSRHVRQLLLPVCQSLQQVVLPVPVQRLLSAQQLHAPEDGAPPGLPHLVLLAAPQQAVLDDGLQARESLPHSDRDFWFSNKKNFMTFYNILSHL